MLFWRWPNTGLISLNALELKPACMTVMMLCALTAAAVLRRRQVAVPRSVLQRATGSRLRDGRRREPLRPSLAAPCHGKSMRLYLDVYM